MPSVFDYTFKLTVEIGLFSEGMAIILRVTRIDSWLAKAVANTYCRLTLGCLVSIVGARTPHIELLCFSSILIVFVPRTRL